MPLPVKRSASLSKGPYPWHVFIWPAIPVLGLLAENLAMAVPEAVVRPLVVAELGAALVCLLIWALVGNLQRAALAVSVGAFIFLSQSNIAALSERLQLPPSLLVGPIQPLLLVGLILQSRRSLAQWTTFANLAGVGFAALMTWTVGTSLVGRWIAPAVIPPPLVASDSTAGRRPDIYIVIVDAYGRADILREYYGVENRLPEHLRSIGFSVPEKAASNYSQTILSLPSLLNFEYLPALLGPQSDDVPPRHRLADLIADNRVFRTLSAAGYRIVTYRSEYSLIRPSDPDEHRGPWLSITDFELGLYEQSMAPLLSVLTGRSRGAPMRAIHRNQVRWTLDELENQMPGRDDPPTLVFAHLLVPHPPFAFEADGTPLESELPALLSDGSQWRVVADKLGQKDRYEEGYAKAIRFLDNRLPAIFTRITGGLDGRRAIVYVQGDHGPGSRLIWDQPARSDPRERMGILLAVRFPDGSPETLYDSITPINAMRTVLNNALGTQLPLLEDRSYFSPGAQPTDFTDVTAFVR